jgi:glycosyltransferase involved in cell wall biosynthesis
MNKVLIVTYYWPPGSGAGVQRWLKFAKYLPASGWEPVTYPAIDNSLSDEVSPVLKVYRTRATDWFSIYRKDKSKIPSAGFAANEDNSFSGRMIRFVRGNFFIPDPRRGWNRYALREASRLIENGEIKHIITTSPPHSTQLIGLKLKKKYPFLKWMADLRDPWTDIYYYDSFLHTMPARKIDENYEMKVLGTADKIITIGNSLKKSFCNRVPGIENKIEIITNGFDEDDFKEISPEAPSVFTISYIGTLSDAYPVSGFMNAAENLASKGFKLRLRFVGSVSSGQRNIISSKTAALKIEFIPYVNHREAINYMTSSSVLLLIIPDHRSNKSIITGKLFEYIASGRPIICIGPVDGDAADIIERSGTGKCAAYSEAVGISRIIDHYYKRKSDKSQNALSEFTRESLTKKLVMQLGNNEP